jgi:hypothetical protein
LKYIRLGGRAHDAGLSIRACGWRGRRDEWPGYVESRQADAGRGGATPAQGEPTDSPRARGRGARCHRVWYLINSNCETINTAHGAVPSAAKEKVILPPVVTSARQLRCLSLAPAGRASRFGRRDQERTGRVLSGPDQAHGRVTMQMRITFAIAIVACTPAERTRDPSTKKNEVHAMSGTGGTDLRRREARDRNPPIHRLAGPPAALHPGCPVRDPVRRSMGCTAAG